MVYALNIVRIISISLISIGLVFMQPVVAQSNDDIKFKQDAVSISTTQYGAFLIDRDGFIWIGTTGLGVLRYDGYELKRFGESVPGSMVSSIVEDEEGEIWISSFSYGITNYNKETGAFTSFKHNRDDSNSLCSNNISFSPQKLYVSKSNDLWVGTDDAGLCKYDKTRKEWTQYKQVVGSENGLNDNAILSIVEDGDGFLWVGTERGGLNRYDQKNDSWTHFVHKPNDPNSLSDNWVNSLLIDRDGVLWLGTKNGGLNRFNAETNTFSRFVYSSADPSSIGSNDVWSLTEDNSGAIWVTHIVSPSSGVDKFDKKSGKFTRYQHDLKDPTSVSSNSIVRVYEDNRNDSLWVVNYDGGIDRHDGSSTYFRHWTDGASKPDSLSDHSILPIIEGRDNIVWVGTMSGGLNRIDKSTGKVTHYLPDSNDPLSIPRIRVTALTEDPSGILWVGFWDGVLASFDPVSGKCIDIYEHDPTDPFSITKSERLKYILQDKDEPNILWLATIKGGLDRFDKEKKVFTHFEQSKNNSISEGNKHPSYNSIVTLYDDGKGTLWIPTYGGGLDRFDKKNKVFTNYRNKANDPSSIATDTLYEIIETIDGQLWVARKGGISHFNPQSGAFKNFESDNDGIPYGPVGSLLEDDEGALWLSTLSGGIVRFNPKSEETKRFTVDDGLQSNTFFWSSRLKARDGEVWFGGSNGITSFYPSDVKNNLNVPPVFLTAFTQGGEPVKTGASPEKLKEVTLGWQKNYFEFQFSSLSFTSPGKNQYSYKLEGWDDEWYYAGSTPFGRYSGLAGGRYVLRLKGANNDGVWNTDNVSIVINVTPPFWKANWFYAIVALLVSILVAAVIFYISKMRKEIHERKLAEEKILHQAHFDSLTNLPNRFLCLDRLTQLISEAKRYNKKVGVLFIDLDDFKKVNDTLGHATGDKLLVEASSRLNKIIRTGDTVGRLGGDEFIVLLGDIEDPADIYPVVEKLVCKFRDIFKIDGRELVITTSVGISVYPTDGESAPTLLKHADSAMYHAKNQGRNTYSYFTDEMNKKLNRRLVLEEQMRDALNRQEFEVFYQPKLNLENNKIMGAEALLRWCNPVLGDVSPAEFIPIAEQTGLIIPIGQFVLEQALCMTAQWHKNINNNFCISVNLSPSQFRDAEMTTFINATLNKYGVSSDFLEMEITEGVLMSGHSFIDQALMKLSRLGVGIAMDDFGTGYSSLSYLRDYPFTVLKIDRSFVKGVSNGSSDRELINAAITMAHGLKLKVVAEGIETKEQLAILVGMGCDYGQGYLFGKAIPPNEFTELLEQEK